MTKAGLWPAACVDTSPPPALDQNARDVIDFVTPLLAAAIAALVVVWQMRQADRHRVEDRKANAIIALNRLLYREVELGKPELWVDRAFLRFKNNENLVEGIALLEPTEQDVGRWVSAERNKIIDIIDVAVPDRASRGSKGTASAVSSETGLLEAWAMGANNRIVVLEVPCDGGHWQPVVWRNAVTRRC